MTSFEDRAAMRKEKSSWWPMLLVGAWAALQIWSFWR
jgi:hypothetical protein